MSSDSNTWKRKHERKKEIHGAEVVREAARLRQQRCRERKQAAIGGSSSDSAGSLNDALNGRSYENLVSVGAYAQSSSNSSHRYSFSQHVGNVGHSSQCSNNSSHGESFSQHVGNVGHFPQSSSNSSHGESFSQHVGDVGHSSQSSSNSSRRYSFSQHVGNVGHSSQSSSNSSHRDSFSQHVGNIHHSSQSSSTSCHSESLSERSGNFHNYSESSSYSSNSNRERFLQHVDNSRKTSQSSSNSSNRESFSEHSERVPHFSESVSNSSSSSASSTGVVIKHSMRFGLCSPCSGNSSSSSCVSHDFNGSHNNLVRFGSPSQVADNSLNSRTYFAHSAGGWRSSQNFVHSSTVDSQTLVKDGCSLSQPEKMSFSKESVASFCSPKSYYPLKDVKNVVSQASSHYFPTQSRICKHDDNSCPPFLPDSCKSICVSPDVVFGSNVSQLCSQLGSIGSESAEPLESVLENAVISAAPAYKLRDGLLQDSSSNVKPQIVLPSTSESIRISPPVFPG